MREHFVAVNILDVKTGEVLDYRFPIMFYADLAKFTGKAVLFGDQSIELQAAEWFHGSATMAQAACEFMAGIHA